MKMYCLSKTYVEDLFIGESWEDKISYFLSETLIGPPVTKDEIQKA